MRKFVYKSGRTPSAQGRGTCPLIGITDKILPVAKEWQQRPLEAVYAVVFLDAIHHHVRSEGQIVKKAVYIALGVNLDGKKTCWGCGWEKTKVPSTGQRYSTG